jgi:hypothetical protein
MTSTRHSIEQAVSIQRDFETAFASKSGVVGVGIGMNRAQDDFALNVFVSKSIPELPESFNGLDVIIEHTSEFETFS